MDCRVKPCNDEEIGSQSAYQSLDEQGGRKHQRGLSYRAASRSMYQWALAFSVLTWVS